MPSIIVNFTDLANIQANVICAPSGGLEIVTQGLKVNDNILALVGNSGVPQYEVEKSFGNDVGSSIAENIFISKLVPANILNDPGLAAIRFKAWGHISNNTTVTTFIPRIRWNTTPNLSGSPITLITGPTIQGTSTSQTLKHWELEMVFVFNSPIAFVTLNLTNHTEDTTGLPKNNCINNTSSGVNLVSTNVNRYIMLTWQMNNSSSGLRVATYAATMEFLYGL